MLKSNTSEPAGAQCMRVVVNRFTDAAIDGRTAARRTSAAGDCRTVSLAGTVSTASAAAPCVIRHPRPPPTPPRSHEDIGAMNTTVRIGAFSQVWERSCRTIGTPAACM
ncbi:hypothetical protein GCM10009730_45530 [Streptomyces albidochromogenes]